MIELITVYVVIGLFVAAWIGACIDAQGVKKGLKIAIGLPLIVIILIMLLVYIIHSFIVVFGGQA